MLIFALLSAVMTAALLPVVLGSNSLFMRDVANFHWPAKLEQALALKDGTLPFVDGWRGGGQPGLGNLNTLALYPTSLLIAAMPTRGAQLWAFNAHFWLHLLLAPLAFAVMAGELGLRRAGRWLGAAVYSTSGFALSLLAYYNLIAALVWVPLLIAMALRVVRGTASLPILGLAGCWSLLLLAGDPTTCLIAATAVLTVILGLRFSRPALSAGQDAGTSPVAGSWWLVGAALVCGTLLAWPQLQEFRSILDESVRTTLGYSGSGVLRGSVPPAMAIDQLFPFALGAPNTLFWASRLHGGAQPLFYSLSFGVLGVAMALLAVWLLLRSWTGAQAGHPRLAAVLGLLWTIGGLLVSLGAHNPLILLLVEWRAFGWLRFPVKAWWLVAMGVGLLAGWALDSLRVSGDSGKRAARAGAWLGSVLATMNGAFLMAVAGGWFLSWYERVVGGAGAAEVAADALPRLMTAALLGLGIAVLVLVTSARGLWGSRVWIALLLVHAVSQLILMRPLYPTLSAGEMLSSPAVLAGLPPGTRVVHGSVGGGFGSQPSTTDEVELSSLQRSALRAGYPAAGVGIGVRYHLNRSPEGLDSFRPGLFSQVVRSVDDAAKVRLIEALGIEYLISERPVEGAGSMLERSVEGVANRYRLPNARPLLAAGRWVAAETPQSAFQTMLDPTFDPTSTVVVDRVPLVAGTATAVTLEAAEQLEGVEPARVQVVRESRHVLEVTVVSSVPVVLATDRAYLPRYAVTVDGQATVTLAANVARLAVAVPAGEHRVVFEFDRSGWWMSCAVSLLGVLTLALLVFRRRRRVD